MNQKIWVLSKTAHCENGHIRGAVVCANSNTEARKCIGKKLLHPVGDRTDWENPKEVICELIGISERESPYPSIVLISTG